MVKLDTSLDTIRQEVDEMHQPHELFHTRLATLEMHNTELASTITSMAESVDNVTDRLTPRNSHLH
jgi:hypothetical protein